MGQVLHGSATTTEAVRRAIQRSQDSGGVRAACRPVSGKPWMNWAVGLVVVVQAALTSLMRIVA